MLENACLDYREVINLLKTIILNREFGAIIEFEKILQKDPIFLEFNSYEHTYTEELEIIELCSIYIFYVMLNKEEENIFPYLREYVAKTLLKSYNVIESKNAMNLLENTYNLEEETIEQRYLFYICGRGFNTFDSNLGLEEMNEFSTDGVKKLMQKIFTLHYSQFTTLMIQGFCLLYRNKNKVSFMEDESVQLFFDIILRRIAKDLLFHLERNDEEDKLAQDIFFDQIDKINFV